MQYINTTSASQQVRGIQKGVERALKQQPVKGLLFTEVVLGFWLEVADKLGLKDIAQRAVNNGRALAR